MKKAIFILIGIISFVNIFSQKVETNLNKLTKAEKAILIDKGTEVPYSGKYLNNKVKGVYVCKMCDTPLYRSGDKFDSSCGWPSFDDEIKGAVRRILDVDGVRTEIVCANCGGHLGHVFVNEGFTVKNIRHCVNSLSLKFIPDSLKRNQETIYFAGGCFWGTEYYLKKAKGVVRTSVGYIGGHKKNPTYQEVCTGKTGHAEVVAVVYDKSKASVESLIKLFFEIHDFTQINRQGPDIGEQYRTEIFYTTSKQKDAAAKLITLLVKKGYKVATKLTKANKYFKAEKYHQDYYSKKGSIPYCHFRKKIF